MVPKKNQPWTAWKDEGWKKDTEKLKQLKISQE